jgi:hypothetical protein
MPQIAFKAALVENSGAISAMNLRCRISRKMEGAKAPGSFAPHLRRHNQQNHSPS